MEGEADERGTGGRGRPVASRTGSFGTGSFGSGWSGTGRFWAAAFGAGRFCTGSLWGRGQRKPAGTRPSPASAAGHGRTAHAAADRSGACGTNRRRGAHGAAGGRPTARTTVTGATSCVSVRWRRGFRFRLDRGGIDRAGTRTRRPAGDRRPDDRHL